MTKSGEVSLASSPTRASSLFISCLVSLFGLSSGTAVAAPDPTYAALRKARPDGPAVPARDLVIKRDVFRLGFQSGAFYFLAPVSGRSLGAVFVGRGSFSLTPASESERRHLAILTGSKDPSEITTLSDTFEEMVLFFGAGKDGLEEEIRQKGAAIAEGAGAEGGSLERAREAFERHLKRQRKDFGTNFHLRLLAELLDARVGAPNAPALLLAFVDGKKTPPSLLAVDPSGVEALRLGEQLGGATVALYAHDQDRPGYWYLEHSKADLDADRAPEALPPVDALHYAIDTRILKNRDIEGTALLRLQVKRPGLRVLAFNLLPKLRLVETGFAPGEIDSLDSGPTTAFTSLPFVQEPTDEDADAAVIFPNPLVQGDTITLRLVYKGDEVLEDAGDGNYVVGARTSWYPNVGTFSDPATFDLTFRVPKRNEVLSVGTRIEAREVDGFAYSRFRAEHPIRVAGFNYGEFRKLERVDEDSGFRVLVYTNKGTPSVARELRESIDFGGFDTERLAESALADGINTARTGRAFFGPLANEEVAITQQSQWSFGQSWPGLIFLPYIAFLDSTTRLQLGLRRAKDFVDVVGPHEFAHQWWGHHVGWKSYRDQWLSEGFAEFSAALVLEQAEGRKRYLDFLEKARKRVLGRPVSGTRPNVECGPITLGHRLASRQTPDAYGALVYSKGAFVLHMLRMLMKDPKDGDGRFIATMKDFAATYASESPSTDDFQHTVEKHMSARLDAARDRKMDWFFRQWVHGTEVPTLRHTLTIAPSAEGRYRISGQITQSDVSPRFLTPVPVYVDLGKDAIAQVGSVVVVGNASVPVDVELPLPRKPRKVLVNAMMDVLARD